MYHFRTKSTQIKNLNIYLLKNVKNCKCGNLPLRALFLCCASCYSDKCKYCDSYEHRYSPEIADLNAGLDDIVQNSVTHNENVLKCRVG